MENGEHKKHRSMAFDYERMPPVIPPLFYRRLGSAQDAEEVEAERRSGNSIVLNDELLSSAE